MKNETYRRRSSDPKMPWSIKVIFIICALAVLILLSPLVCQAQPVRVYCQNMFGQVTIHQGMCPLGYTFIGVVEE